MMDLRTLGPPGVFQNLDAPARNGEQDHVQGLPYYVKGPYKDLVQQVDAQFH